MLFWGKTEKVFSTVSCAAVAYSLPSDCFDSNMLFSLSFLCLLGVILFSLLCSLCPPLFTLLRTSLSHLLYTFFLSNLIYYFSLSYSLIFSKLGS